MNRALVPFREQHTQFQISPEYARISMAAAIELGLKPGRFLRDCVCGCVNLLQNYPEGCYANCSYCGLARERPGVPEGNSFIRVAWPLYPMALIAERIAEREHLSGVGRVCLSQVQDHRSNDDLLSMVALIRSAVPTVPVAALVNATTMSLMWLERLRSAGVSNIGIGLDTASKRIFEKARGRETCGPHTWEQHIEIMRLARGVFGPMNVNCHVIVGLGETDMELVDLFAWLKQEEVAAYLFSFNPEPGTAMQHIPRQPITRHRRIQLVKHLVEEFDIAPSAVSYDPGGFIASVDVDRELIDRAIESGTPFMTDGCPDRTGVMACNRPFGSYRPGEEFRDYPFVPGESDLEVIRVQLNLGEICPAYA